MSMSMSMSTITASFNVCIKYVDTATFYRVKPDLPLWRVFNHFTRHQCLDPDHATFWLDGKPLDPLRHTFKDVFTNAFFNSGVPEITCFYEEHFSSYCTCPGSVHFENMEPVCACHAPFLPESLTLAPPLAQLAQQPLAPLSAQQPLVGRSLDSATSLATATSLASAASSARFDCPCTVF